MMGWNIALCWLDRKTKQHKFACVTWFVDVWRDVRLQHRSVSNSNEYVKSIDVARTSRLFQDFCYVGNLLEARASDRCLWFSLVVLGTSFCLEPLRNIRQVCFIF